jgi:dienelactone hydrolase
MPSECWDPQSDQSFRVAGTPQELTWTLISAKDAFPQWKLSASFLDRFQGTALVSISAAECSAYFLSSVGRDKLALLGVDLRSGREKVLFEGDVDISYAVVDPTSQSIAAVGIDDPYPRVIGLNRLTQEVLGSLSYLDTLGLRLIDIALGGRFWLLRSGDATCQPRWVVVDTVARAVAWEMPVPGSPSASCRRSIFRVNVDGEVIDAIVTTPAQRDCRHERCPVLLSLHGGPALRDTFDVEPLAAALAASGAVTLSVNYRGSLGYGKRFMSLDAKNWGAAIPRDVYAALDHFSRTAGMVGPVAAVGSSFGGYLAMLAATRDGRASCAAAHAATPDLKEFVTRTAEATGGATDLLIRVGDPNRAEDLASMLRNSPATYVAKGSAPMLLVHGGRDSIALPESQIKFARDRSKQAPVTMTMLKNEGHDILGVHDRIFYYSLLARFLSRCMLEEPEIKAVMRPDTVDVIVDGLKIILEKK